MILEDLLRHASGFLPGRPLAIFPLLGDRKVEIVEAALLDCCVESFHRVMDKIIQFLWTRHWLMVHVIESNALAHEGEPVFRFRLHRAG